MSNYTLSGRFDSEFFKKEYLKDDKSIAKNGFNKLVEITNKINVGFVGAMVKHYRVEGVTILQTKNVDAFFIKDDDTIKISPEFHNELKKSQVHKKSILIARSGSFGKASIYLDDEVINSSDIIIVEANENKINPYFLVSYLNSKFGINQMIRFASGGLQGHVNLTILEELEVPRIDDGFQKKIESILKLSYTKKLTSKFLYTQAENLLLKEIGLQDFTPSKEAVNIKTFSESFGTSGRMDAEYYQPKYDIIEQAVKNYSNGFETLDYFIDNYSMGYPYKSSSYIESNGISLIRINNIKKGHLDLSNAIEIPKSDLDLSVNDIANENDLLISMSGTIGNSCKIPKGIKAVVNQRIMRITPKNFNNEVLPLVINSLIGEYQLNRIGTGGVQTNISSNDIRKIFIPKIKEEIQQKIASLIAESFTLKKQSERLLEISKKAVEIAIEENEEEALGFINRNYRDSVINSYLAGFTILILYVNKMLNNIKNIAYMLI